MRFTLFAILLVTFACSTTPDSQKNSPLTDTIQLVGQAAASAPEGVHGKFMFIVKEAEKSGERVYLNTQLDYRDQRNITIVLSPSVVAHFDKENQKASENFFLDKKLRVTGIAKQTRINFYCQRKKTGKYYFQTHLAVDSPEQLQVIGEVPRPANRPVKKTAFQKSIDKYLSQKDKKAFAYVWEDKKGMAWGFGHGFDTQEEADKKALKECNSGREKRDIKKECAIDARGDELPILAWGNGNYNGCGDPRYATYIERRLEQFELNEKQLYQKALNSLQQSPYESLSKREKFKFVRSNTIYSARFDSAEVATLNIERLNSGLMKSKYFEVKDGDIPHISNIARGWIALNAGNEKEAIHYLLEATKTEGSPMLGSFGPDESLIRELYRRGHKKAVLKYLELSDVFWNTEHAIGIKEGWRKLINNGCPVQFEFYDKTHLEKFGL